MLPLETTSVTPIAGRRSSEIERAMLISVLLLMNAGFTSVVKTQIARNTTRIINSRKLVKRLITFFILSPLVIGLPRSTPTGRSIGL